jgi:ABC-type transport system involved in multi-copper enzyme maturation permease subunit
MYYWKCWRDTRTSFFVYLGAFTLLAAWISFFPVLHFSNERGHYIEYPHSAEDADRVRKTSTAALVPGGLMVAMLAGIGLGASGVGSEFTPGTLEFLLTRPRRRRFFLWAGWSTIAIQIAILVALYIVISIAGIALVSGLVTPRAIIAFPIAMTAALAAMGVAYFLTVAGREAKHGAMVGLLFAFGYPVFVVAVRQFWKVNLPTPWSLVPARGPDPSGILYTTIPFPYASMAGWLAFAVVLPYLAQLLFDRAEV